MCVRCTIIYRPLFATLQIMYIKGEAASSDHEAAKKFPTKVRDIIKAKGYVPKQIFNCDETGLYWKIMPSQNFLTQAEIKAPGFKVAKDRLTFLLCSNTSGTFRCKPMLVYRAENQTTEV